MEAHRIRKPRSVSPLAVNHLEAVIQLHTCRTRVVAEELGYVGIFYFCLWLLKQLAKVRRPGPWAQLAYLGSGTAFQGEYYNKQLETSLILHAVSFLLSAPITTCYLRPEASLPQQLKQFWTCTEPR